MGNDPTSVAEQRANAVEKLRRATSLPRMKDGRRPPMHIEAVSDGEKFQARDEQDVPEPEPGPEPEPDTEPVQDTPPSGGDPVPESPPETKSTTPEPSTSGRKRRNRSRSRSRGSRDFKGKLKPPQSPVPTSITPANDSSPDDSPPSPPPVILQHSSVIAPVPSYFSNSPTSRVLMSPNLPSPATTPLLYPGTSPPPLMSQLDTIQRSLLRSNSVAARTEALKKLTGGPVDPADAMSSSPHPSLARLARNNTVSGGEQRSAARMKLFIALSERIKEADETATSGGEERPGPVSSTPAKRRRRRSGRNSTSTSNQITATDDSEVLSTSTGTPTHPPTPLPYTQQPPAEPVRTASTTPIPVQSISTPNINLDESIAGSRQATPVRAVPNQWKRRSIVVEPDDDVPIPPQSTYPGLPVTPRRPSPGVTSRLPHSSDAPSTVSNDSVPDAVGVPVFLSGDQRSPSRQDLLPSSPFSTPHKEVSLSSRDDGDDMEPEEVVYPAEHLRRSPYRDAYNRQISWVADPVPESSIVVHNEDDEDEEQMRGIVEDDDDHIPPESPHEESGVQTEESSPRASSDSKELVVDIEPVIEPPSASLSQELVQENSSQAPTSNTTSTLPVGDESDSSLQAYPQRLSVASRMQSDRSPLTAEFDLDSSLTVPETPSLKRDGSLGSWGKILVGALTRSSSSNGRRSRTNSLAARERRQNTDSSISRESGGSLASPKADKNELGSAFPFGGQQSVMQSSSASTSMQSLALPTPPRSGVSPIPLASNLDLTKYNQDAKLFPFPGIKKLEEQRINNRNRRGFSISSSTPDIVLSLHGNENEMPLPSSPSSNTPSHSPDIKRDRVLAHQVSDTHLLSKFKSLNSPPLSTAPSSSSHDYINAGQVPNTPQSAGSILLKTLPTNREGVRKWLSNRFGSSAPTLAINSPASAPQTIRPTIPSKKPSLSEILRWKKESDLTSDWEDISSPEKSRTPTSTTSGNLLLGKLQNGDFSTVSPNGSATHEDMQKTPRASKIAKSSNDAASSPLESITPPTLGTSTSPPTPSPPEPAPSSTPEPWSSLSDYPPPTTSESSSNTSSQYSEYPSRGTVIMERLDEMIGRGPKSPVWPSAIDDPPRKLLLAAPVLQVVNSNTVKDRFLFLFNDIFIVTKHIVQEPDSFLELSKPNPSDRKFVVKNVVLLRNLRFSGERDEPLSRTPPRNALTQSFVEQFATDADQAIVWLFNNLGRPDDPVALAQLLFRSPDIDRAQLGDYLSRRTSRVVLKHYLDAFGFTSVRVDKALRIFLHTISLPARTSQTSPLEVFLDSFASRWYDANASQVAYDKDLAYRFSRAIAQLNEVLHGGVNQEPGSTGYSKRSITARAFLDAFRRHDPRALISDEVLSDVYESICREPLSQARHPSSTGPPEITVTFKRVLPSRLTYKVQSEPVVIRIPQPDPNFAIELFGHELSFDPPILSFAKSSEASFRVTGSLFGVTTMLMLRSGPNALLYTGLPSSCPISVERPFMRNTFQVAFLNHNGAPRRYMFSFVDPLVRHEWATSLKRLTDASSSTASSATPFQARFAQAVGDVVFKVLQETLIGPEAFAVQQAPSKLNNALKRLNSMGHSTHDSQFTLASGSPDLARSKSRSRMYYHHGPGKLEAESARLASHSRSSSEDDANEVPPQSRPEERLWSGKDLEMFCQQNSLIAQVLEIILPAVSNQPISSQ